MLLPPPPPPGELWAEFTNNIGICWNRGSSLFANPTLRAEAFSPILVSGKIVERGILSSTTSENSSFAPCYIVEPKLVESGILSSHTSEQAQVAPAYLIDDKSEDVLVSEFDKKRRKFSTFYGDESKQLHNNFSTKFIEVLHKKYPGKPLYPFSTLAYVYGSMNDPNYLNKYRQRVSSKLGLSCIFVDDYELFRYIAWYGFHLMMCHLRAPDHLDERDVNFIGTDTTSSGNLVYEESEKKLWINKSSYFQNIDPLVYQYTIGGYQVLRKYARSYSGEPLDIDHFAKMIRILRRSVILKTDMVNLGAEY